jgi:aspartyl-tRNA(Asn)/glutamyl-tRNA(Gln) amidotransferase subunit A
MPSHSELIKTDAVTLVGLLQRGEVTPHDLLDALEARIAAVDGRVNALPTLCFDRARAHADRLMRLPVSKRGPLAGLPVPIKDLIAVGGVRTTQGSPIYADHIPARSDILVERLEANGGVVYAKSNTPEFGAGANTFNEVFGATRNPWNTSMTTGGSSAGAGAAAAAGLGPLHHGSDGAGSIRIPSAFCGIFGLKPSYGRVPMYPVSNNDYSSHNGPMTRTVADAALMMSVLAGPDEWDRTSLPGPVEDYLGTLRAGVRGLRVAFSPDLDTLRVDPDVAAVVRDAVRAFEALGCTVEEVKTNFADSHQMIRMMWNAHEAGNYARYLPEWRDRMDPGLVASIDDGLRYSVVDYIDMRGQKLAYWDSVRPLFEKYDLLLTPSLSVAAFECGRINPAHWPQPSNQWDWMGWASFSYPFNFTGQPAATCPAGFTPAGLPVGLQIVGRRFADLTVLQASAAFEEARPWAARRPNVDGV